MENSDNLTSVIIATYNRGASIIQAVQSIFKSIEQNFELIIIDQSTNDETYNALQPWIDDPRMRYFRSTIPGVARARNDAIARSNSEYCCITDDDCEVASDWIRKMREFLESDPKIAVVYSSVLPAEYDESTGFIPAYTPDGTIYVKTAAGKCKARGIGASMAVRKSSTIEAGGFDQSLGPGSLYYGCEEGDLTVKLLMRGYVVVETDQTHVLHNGYRTFLQGRTLSRRDFHGIGAAYSKPFKIGRYDYTVIAIYEFFVLALFPLILSILRFKPRGFAPPFYFIQGFIKGLRHPLHPTTLNFVIENEKVSELVSMPSRG